MEKFMILGKIIEHIIMPVTATVLAHYIIPRIEKIRFKKPNEKFMKWLNRLSWVLMLLALGMSDKVGDQIYYLSKIVLSHQYLLIVLSFCVPLAVKIPIAMSIIEEIKKMKLSFN
ncbi:hypothetical protein [Sphingobacterium lactis]|uniref:hypothetical protein n=1 Tax=Sphingobacterium lactis TaxID=797291 RepID=UPI003DA2FE31